MRIILPEAVRTVRARVRMVLLEPTVAVSPGCAAAVPADAPKPASAPNPATASPKNQNALHRDRAAWLLAHASGPLTCALADAARELVSVEGWAPLGFSRIYDLARERLDRSGRWVMDLARLGRALAASPALRAAVVGDDGEFPLSRAAALVLARANESHSMDHWIALARRVTVRELQSAIRADRAGERLDTEAAAGAGTADQVATTNATVSDDDDDDDEALQVRVEVPRWIRACFVETLDLHRAVNGCEATVASFAEALAAEALAGPNPPDVTTVGVRAGTPTSLVEETLARVNHQWAWLGRPEGPLPVNVAAVLEKCRAKLSTYDAEEAAPDAATRAARVEAGAGPGTGAGAGASATQSARRTGIPPREQVILSAWRKLREVLRAEDAIERELGRTLAEMARHGDWATLGFASAGHYARERLGVAQRTAETRIAGETAMRRRPVVYAAYRAGTIGLEAGLLLSRVLESSASASLQQRWVDRARQTTVKRLRDEIHLALLRSDLPDGNLAAPEPQRPATDGEWLASLDRPPGRTRERLARAMPNWNEFTPTSALVSADVFLRLRLPREVAKMFLASLESERRRLQGEAEANWGSERETDSKEPVSRRVAHLFADRGRRLPSWVALLALLEDYAKTWDDPAAFPKRRWHRTYERANWRCMAPGCTARRWHDDHHIEYRSRGGSNEAWNQLCLCRFHHQQGEHGRFARVRGRGPLGVIWRLGTRALASWYRNEVRLDAGDDADAADADPANAA